MLDTMKLLDHPILGVVLAELDVHADSRGSFCEVWRKEWFPGEWQQANRSVSRAGVFRGLHLHEHQRDLWRCESGTVLAVLADARGPLMGKAPRVVYARLDHPGKILLIPRGVLHGYYADSDAVVHYMVDQTYNPKDEHGVFWGDHALGVSLPTVPTISPRDASAPRWHDLSPGLLGRLGAMRRT